MGISRLSPDDIDIFLKNPEVGMDTQVGRKNRGGEYVLIVGGRIAVTIDEAIVPQLNEYLRVTDTIFRMGQADDLAGMERWAADLPLSSHIDPLPLNEALWALGFIHLGPRFPLPPLPSRPSVVYGHLPFHGICSGTERFYRYEHYPTSIRIDLAKSEVVKPDTFAAPERERRFVNSGLGAVARYALRSLLPARWRYELRPPSGTSVHYGACVPMFGQSGGGVEVSFPNTFKNTVAIPAPTVLPIF
jgi:hypothetical protein